jgi:hypothetical protein
VTLGAPSLNVPPVEFEAARAVAANVREDGLVLAPESVSTWLTVFVRHPRLVGVRQMYLSLAFPPGETAQRSNLMRYVGGFQRPPGAARWFAASIRERGVTAVVVDRDAPWAGEIEGILRSMGWQRLSCGRYGILVRAYSTVNGTVSLRHCAEPLRATTPTSRRPRAA